MHMVMYTDGGARGNPGPSGAGVSIQKDGIEIAHASKFLGVCTNNWAEYEALILGLETVRSLGHRGSVAVRMDSELIVKQMKGEYRVKDPELKKQHARVQSLCTHFPSVSFEHIRREQNVRADQLANDAMDRA